LGLKWANVWATFIRSKALGNEGVLIKPDGFVYTYNGKANRFGHFMD